MKHVLRFLLASLAALSSFRAAEPDPLPTFTFQLPADAVTSAGVYSHDTLIKTLWSNVRYQAGSHTAKWNGTTDDGGVAPRGDYMVRILSSQAKYTWEGVIGNTSDAFTGPTIHHAEDIVHGMAIAGGNIYIAAGYNEGRSSTLKTSLAHPQSKSYILPTPAAHGYTDAYTNFVATDGRYVYWAGCEAALQPTKYFVFATKTDDDTSVEFPGGEAMAVSGGHLKHSGIDHMESVDGAASGLAVQKDGPFLFVSHRKLHKLHVLDKTSGALVKAIDMNEPTSLAADAAGHLWVADRQDEKPVVRQYTVANDGALTPTARSEITDLRRPLALAVSPDNKTLLVADGGESQQLRAFDNGTAAPLWTYGQPGGYARSPEVRNDKFFFRNIDNVSRHQNGYDWSYLAFEPDGSFWVGDCGNFRSQCFAADRTFQQQIMWIPTFYTALVDLNNPERVFADFLEFHVDYSKPLAPDNGSWTLVRNWGGIEQPPAYSHTGRGYDHATFPWQTVATLSNGRTYATFRNYAANKMGVAELDPAKGLRFTSAETPALFYDLAPDGSIRTISPAAAGKPTLWISHALKGFDSQNDPQWEEPRTVASSPPLDRQVFDHASFSSGLQKAWEMTPSGILPSFDAQAPLPGYAKAPVSHNGWHLAGLDAKTGTWRWRGAPSTLRTYAGDWPTDGSFDTGNSVGNSGSFVHVVGDNLFWQYYGEGWKGGETNMWTLVHDDGLMVGQFGVVQHIMPDGTEDEGQPGMAGNATSHGIVRRPDGTVYIYHNDEGFHGGIHRWRIENLGSIREQTVPVKWNSDVVVRPHDPGDLLEGLPFGSSVANNVAGWHRSPAADVLKDTHLDWWSVKTNVTNYLKEVSSDIDISFAHRPGSLASITRDLGDYPAPLAEWKLSAVVRFAWPNVGKYEGLSVEILDDAGKVIAQLSPVQVTTGNYRVLGNGQTLFQSTDSKAFNRYIQSGQPLTIEAHDGEVSIAYGSQTTPLKTAISDPQSHWRSPKALQVRFWTTTGGYHHGVNFQKLHFYPGAGASASPR
jgi:DNA-binding beta-propeller fold protein YncE